MVRFLSHHYYFDIKVKDYQAVSDKKDKKIYY